MDLDMTDLMARASRLPTATLYEANRQDGALPSAIKPAVSGMRLCGPAFTVQGPAKDNLWLHRGIAEAPAGSVLVCHVGNHHEAGYWGEVMSTAALVRGLAGVVIDGGARDRDLLEEIGFPVFCRGLCIRGTGKDREARGALGGPVAIGDVIVHTGDLVVGDADGVVTIRADRLATTLDRAEERERREAAMIDELRRGASTLDLLGLR